MVLAFRQSFENRSTPTNYFNNKLRNLHHKISQGAKIWNDSTNDTKLLSLKHFKKNLMLIHRENNNNSSGIPLFLDCDIHTTFIYFVCFEGAQVCARQCVCACVCVCYI